MTRLAIAKSVVLACFAASYATAFAMPIASRTTSAVSALLLTAIMCAGAIAYRLARGRSTSEAHVFVATSLLLLGFELASLAFSPAEVVGWIAASAYVDAISWVSITAAVLMLAFVARIAALRSDASPADARGAVVRE